MNKKKIVLFNLIFLIIGIAIGVGIEAFLVNNTFKSNNDIYTGTFVDDDEISLFDENGNKIEISETEQEGIVYNVCVFKRKGEEISNHRDWYGPYTTVKTAIIEVKKALYFEEGIHEIHIYKTSLTTGKLTFFGKTYYASYSQQSA